MQLSYNRDKYLSEFSIKTLEDRYLVEGETSPQDAFARAARAFADDEEHAQRLYDYPSALTPCTSPRTHGTDIVPTPTDTTANRR